LELLTSLSQSSLSRIISQVINPLAAHRSRNLIGLAIEGGHEYCSLEIMPRARLKTGSG